MTKAGVGQTDQTTLISFVNGGTPVLPHRR